MTSLIEKIVAFIAPHHCLGCGAEDNVLCASCIESQVLPLEPVCFLCGLPANDWQPCATHQSPLSRVWLASEYGGLVEKVVHNFKFGRMRAAGEPLATLIGRALPYGSWMVTAVPTASGRVRQRGYDQALLLGRALAANRGLQLSPALGRLHSARQVGANRVQRQKQSTKMFFMQAGVDVRGAQIVLVDDVCTTGATLQAAARMLRAAGAADVCAVVAAWQAPEHKRVV